MPSPSHWARYPGSSPRSSKGRASSVTLENISGGQPVGVFAGEP